MNDTANQSHEVEYQLIGSCLKDGKVFQRVNDILRADSLHSAVCIDIYRAMQAVHAQGITVDQVTVGDQMQRAGTLDNVMSSGGIFTGRAAISKLRDIGNPKNAEAYAYTVRDYYGKRLQLEAATKIATWSQNGRRAVDISADGKRLLEDIDLVIGSGSNRTLSTSEAASRTWDMSVSASKGNIKSVRTGLIDLDKWFKMRPKTFTVIAGRPGTGKSALLDTIALNHAIALYKTSTAGNVLILSLEMSMEQVTARLLSQICELSTTQILDGEMNADEWTRYGEAIEYFEKLPIKISDVPAMAIGLIRTEARRYLKDGEDNLLCVDYLQLATSGQNKNSRVDEVGAVARGLKVLALDGEKGLAVLAAAQLSRAVEQRAEKRPVMSDLRESGNIEQDADNIIFLHAEEDDIAEKIKRLIVEKQRNGATRQEKGDVIVRWNAPIMRFENSAIKIMQLN
jgi:replicative DNA helicase